MASAREMEIDHSANGMNLGELAPVKQVTIRPPNFQMVELHLVGIAPLCQNRFSQKAKEQMVAQQQAGSTAKKGKTREAKNFEQAFENAQYKSKEGWVGVPCSSFRNAAISACRIVGFKMTLAKLGVFIEADGFDAEDGTPLVRLIADKPVMRIHNVRNASGVVDQRPRPFWDEWEIALRVKFDGDMFSVDDVVNLFARVGLQVGVGEGRPDSKMSAGMGWGCFRLKEEGETSAAKKSNKSSK